VNGGFWLPARAEPTTAIVLAYLRADRIETAAIVRWGMMEEQTTASFRVERSATREGPCEAIGAVESQGTPATTISPPTRPRPWRPLLAY
jgi:hypothetical protein